MRRTWEATETLEVAASPEAVWAIVTDVAGHAALAGSGEVKAVRLDGPLRQGGSWEADEKVMGRSFAARSECTELDEPSRFAWKSFPPPMRKGRPDSVPDVTWTFDLREVKGGTRVSHSYRVAAPPAGGTLLAVVYALSRRPQSIQKGMRGTLQNLKQRAEQSSTRRARPGAGAGR